MGGISVMPGELDSLSKAIGGLEAEMRILTRTVHDNHEASTREHRTVHDIVVATSEAVRNLTKIVGEMKPLTDDYREKRAEARGAAKLAKVLYAAALAIGSAVGSGVTWLIHFLVTGPKPH